MNNFEIPKSLLDVDDWKSRKQHIEKLEKSIKGFLENPKADELLEIFSELWSISAVFRGVSGIRWHVEKRILAKISLGNLADNLDYLVDENLPIEKRLSNLKIPGMGLPTISEILFVFYPEKYPIFNKRSLLGLEKLGLKFENSKEILTKYMEFTKKCYDLANILEQFKLSIEQKTGTDVSRFNFLDKIFSSIHDGDISPTEIKTIIAKLRPKLKVKSLEETCLNYALSSITGAVKQYFYWLNKGDSEELAIDKTVNYALGVISSSGVLTNKENLEKFKNLLVAISELSKGIFEIIEETEKVD